MKTWISFIFAFLVAQFCFSQTSVGSSAKATVVSIPNTLKEYHIGSLSSLKDTIRVFDSIQASIISRVVIEVPTIEIGISTISDVEKIEGHPRDIKRYSNFEATKLVYDSVTYFFRNNKLDFVSDKRLKKPTP